MLCSRNGSTIIGGDVPAFSRSGLRYHLGRPADRHPPMPRPAAPAHSDAPPDPRRWLGLAGIGTGIFMFTLDGSIVNVALPTLASALGASLAAVQWVPLAYLLVITSLVGRKGA